MTPFEELEKRISSVSETPVLFLFSANPDAR